MMPRLRHVIGELHAEKVVHVGTERLLDAQCHFRCQRGLGVEKVGERGAAHFQNLRRLRHVKTEGFDDLDAPVLRVSDADVPLPYAANLEKLALIKASQVVEAVKAVTYR